MILHVNDTRVPRLRESDGFRLDRVAKGLDAETDQFVTVSRFEVEAAMDASVKIAAAWVAEAGGKLAMNWMKDTLADTLAQQTAAIMGEIELRIFQEAPAAT